jgi:hypothetical protein
MSPHGFLRVSVNQIWTIDLSSLKGLNFIRDAGPIDNWQLWRRKYFIFPTGIEALYLSSPSPYPMSYPGSLK